MIRFATVFLIVLAIYPACADDTVLMDDINDTTPGYAGMVYADADAEQVIDTTIKQTDTPAPRTATPRLSVTTGGLDMNWTGAMELSDPALRPTQIVLPLLEDYPINQLEVKFHPLKVLF